MTDLVVVGSGFFGLTVAERAASALGLNVEVLEARRHIGGNAWSEVDTATGIEVHRYGTHIFHTSNDQVWDYAQRFTSFTPYEHRVWSVADHGRVFSLPINLATICALYGKALSPRRAVEMLRNDGAGSIPEPQSLREFGINAVGRRLYETLIEGYTWKQWQTHPEELPASVLGRLPVRLTFDNRYFSDTHQGMPVRGYGDWLTNLASHPRITVHTGVDYFDPDQPLNHRALIGQVPVVYTGPLDRFFDYAHGPLTWRTLDFTWATHDVGDYQGTAVMNYASLAVPYTRIHEFRHLHPERADQYPDDQTITATEFSRLAGSDDEPYYPVNARVDRARVRQYRNMQEEYRGRVVFGGRLGSYQYLDMHMAIASALSLARNDLPRMVYQ